MGLGFLQGSRSEGYLQYSVSRLSGKVITMIAVAQRSRRHPSLCIPVEFQLYVDSNVVLGLQLY